MGRLMPWTPLRSEPVADCSVFRAERVWTRSPRTGEEHPFYCIEAPDWVNVVPVTARDEIVMIRQYRHGSRSITLEIPGGCVDPGESPAEAARRELLEETGYGGGRLEPIGVVNPNPALFANRCHTFAVRGVERRGPVQNEGHEETEVALVPRAELREKLQSGEIDHALVVAGLLWFALDEMT